MNRREVIYKFMALLGVSVLDFSGDTLSEWVQKTGSAANGELFFVKRTITLPESLSQNGMHELTVNSSLLPEISEAWFANHSACLEQAAKKGELVSRHFSMDEQKGQMSWTLAWTSKQAHENFVQKADVAQIVRALQNRGIVTSIKTSEPKAFNLASVVEKLTNLGA
jgi:hypothetical protein